MPDIARSDTACLLSIVITGRDDGYMPDFRYRLRTTLDHFSRNVERLGRMGDLEILFVDWGSDPPLSDTLPVAPATRKLVRWLHVPPATSRDLLGPTAGFHNTLAFNAGLRRARGQFIAFFPADAIVPMHALGQLIDLLEGRVECPVKVDEALLFLARCHVPWQFVDTQPTIDEWDHHLWLNAWTMPIDEGTVPSLFGGAASFLLSRSQWFACGGLDETLGGWGGSDTDLGFRIGLQHPWLDLCFLGVRAYHMEHGPGGTRGAAVERGNPIPFNRPLRANSDDWGLGAHNLPLVPAAPPIAATPAADHGVVTDTPELSPRGPTAWPDGPTIETQLAAVQAIRQTIRRLGDHLDRIPRRPCELDVLLAIACWCTDHPARSYLDVGIHSRLVMGVAAVLSPAATIHGVAANPPPVVCQAAVFLQLVLRHGGYVHFVFGDSTTAVPRAFDSAPGIDTCDLAVVTCDHDDAVFPTVMKQVFTALAPGGACLLSASSAESFRSKWESTKQSSPTGRFILVGEGNYCGLVLKPGHQRASTANPTVESIRFSPQVVRTLKREMQRRHRRRKLRAWTKKTILRLRSWLGGR